MNDSASVSSSERKDFEERSPGKVVKTSNELHDLRSLDGKQLCLVVNVLKSVHCIVYT